MAFIFDKFNVLVHSLYEWPEQSLYLELIGPTGIVYAVANFENRAQMLASRVFNRFLQLQNVPFLSLYAGATASAKKFIKQLLPNIFTPMAGRELSFPVSSTLIPALQNQTVAFNGKSAIVILWYGRG